MRRPIFSSLLFVPGDRPERFDKAAASGADAVCIDLEDAVGGEKKEAARAEVCRYFTSSPAQNVGLRINQMRTHNGLRDVLALGDVGVAPAFVIIPKLLSPLEVEQLRALLAPERTPIWALIETPDALENAGAIARAIGEEGGLLFGGADYSAAIGSGMSWEALYFARAAIVAAAATGGCQAMDAPWLDVPAVNNMVAETERAKAMGFTGRACIHPTHVEPINNVFTPSPEDIAAAEEMMDAYKKSGGVLLHRGKLVEKPILKAAERVLARKKP